MVSDRFLQQLARKILATGQSDLSRITVVLPNKRARLFLIDAIRKQLDSRIFLPQIISIDQFITSLSGLRIADPVELLFEFYQEYLERTPQEERQDFERFCSWAKTLIQDFNEMDRYLLEVNSVLEYLVDIDRIRQWGIEEGKSTVLVERHLQFWKKLPEYYQAFYDRLQGQSKGYQGMVYREAIRKIRMENPESGPLIFAGFNALNKAEEILFQHYLSNGNTRIYWDIDSHILEDQDHDAGFFMRQYKANWPYYHGNPFEWISSEYSKPKRIRVIGTPKSVGQARIVGELLQEWETDGKLEDLTGTAVVMAQESLLLPVLHSLPAAVAPLNITMGYPSRNTPPFQLISKILKLQVTARTRGGHNQPVFYYRDVLDVLGHPLVEPYAQAAVLVRNIIDLNYTFLPHSVLARLSGAEGPNAFLALLFQPIPEAPKAALDYLRQLVQEIKTRLDRNSDEEKVLLAMLYSAFKVLNQLDGYFTLPGAPTTLDSLRSYFAELAELAEISFEGEPLSGLQIMGILESRLLDFDRLIVTSLNEGNFPAGKGGNSFIPMDVKRERGLPTYKEKDAIFSYHFYRLIQRAEEICLIYNTDSDGLDSGEKSRFLTQLEIEKRPEHELILENRYPHIPLDAMHRRVIPKTERVLERLKELAEKQFSPTSLTAYIRNPIDFFFQKVMKIREAEAVEENIALNTLGTIIHGTLEALYKPYIGVELTEEIIADCRRQTDAVILEQFRLVYKEGDIRKGKNLLAYEVAKRHVSNFLRLESDDIKAGDQIILVALEEPCKKVLEHELLPYPVVIGGNVDRIERRNGVLRITDYKTGKVEKKMMELDSWDGFTADIKRDKVLQVLAYAFMFSDRVPNEPIEVGIVSFKNLKNGFLPFAFKDPERTETFVTPQILEEYRNQLATLLSEILNPDIPFEEAV